MPRAPARAPSPAGADAVLSASSATPDNDRLPVRELITLSITMLSNSLNISVLFPFVGLMVEHLGMTEDRRELGGSTSFLVPRRPTAFARRRLSPANAPQSVVRLRSSLDASAGYYAGYIAGAFMLGRTFTRSVATPRDDRRRPARRPHGLVCTVRR